MGEDLEKFEAELDELMVEQYLFYFMISKQNSQCISFSMITGSIAGSGTTSDGNYCTD